MFSRHASTHSSAKSMNVRCLAVGTGSRRVGWRCLEAFRTHTPGGPGERVQECEVGVRRAGPGADRKAEVVAQEVGACQPMAYKWLQCYRQEAEVGLQHRSFRRHDTRIGRRGIGAVRSSDSAGRGGAPHSDINRGVGLRLPPLSGTDTGAASLVGLLQLQPDPAARRHGTSDTLPAARRASGDQRRCDTHVSQEVW